MKDLETMILENTNEHLISLKLKPTELLTLILLLDISDTDKLEELRHKLEMILRPNINKVFRKFHKLENKFDYNTIFNEKPKEETQEILDIILNDE